MDSFAPTYHQNQNQNQHQQPQRLITTTVVSAAPADSDFEKSLPVVDYNDGGGGGGAVDPNVYNVGLEQAAELWTVSVVPENRLGRVAGIPFLEPSNTKDYFVDDVSVRVSRKSNGGGLGLELLELAGGRDDGYGLTIVENVSGNAKAAGVLPGDSIGSVEFVMDYSDDNNKNSMEETQQTLECECRDFDQTIGLLTSLPPPDQLESIVLNLKRIRRWPKINVVVEYPPVQVADGADNTEKLTLTAGENLRRALLNRGIVLEDPQAAKCDFCGTKCAVKVDVGMPLLSPMSTTEEKIMKNNPKCRVRFVCLPALFVVATLAVCFKVVVFFANSKGCKTLTLLHSLFCLVVFIILFSIFLSIQ